MDNILQQDIMFLPGVGPHRIEIFENELGFKSWAYLLEYYPYN